MKIRKVINHGNIRYRVTANLDGNRTQRFFPSKRDARAWMALVNRLDPLLGFWESLPNNDRKQLSLIHQAGNRLGIDMNTVLKSLGNMKLGKPLSRDLKEAVDDYMVLRASQNLRESSYKQIRSNLNLLVRRHHPLRCDEVTSTMLEKWFAERQWARSTIDGVIAKIGPFFTWCVREGHCGNNPCRAVKRPQGDDSAPAIFTPQQAEKLLLTARESDAAMTPYLAIGLFAGIRPMEIGRLHHSAIREHHIEITAAKSKTRKRRLVTLSDNLKEWLALGMNLTFTNKRKRLEKILEESELKWSPDIMRHSYASYHLAYHQSADKTSLEMGHRDTDMLFQHYRELVSYDDSTKYWNIKPRKDIHNNVNKSGSK